MIDSQDSRLHEAAANGDEVARLLRMTSPRPAVPEALGVHARSVAASEWRRTVRWRRTRRRISVAGAILAAAALVALGWQSWNVTPPPVPGPGGPLAWIEAVRGGLVLSAGADGRLRPLAIGDPVPTGAVIATDAGSRAAFRLAAGQSLRLDVNTRVALVSDSVLQLVHGAVYLDSEGATAPLEVHTPLGVAREVGTQFEVRLADRTMRVRVREGRVLVERDAASWEARSGAELTIAAGGQVDRGTVPLYGPAWRWNLEIAPTFELEGSSLAAYLLWVTRENGWKLRFSDPELATYAEAVVLHGSLEDLTPDQTPDLVLPTCGVVYRIEDGTLIAGYPQR